MKGRMVMASVWFRGQRKTVFIHLPVETDGKYRLPVPTINEIATSLGAQLGQTFTIG